MEKTTDKLHEIAEVTRRLRRDYPEATGSFLTFLETAEAGKALDLRQKELINVALSVAGQCEWCIAFHVKNAIAQGAGRDELVEAGFMAVIMHGGPAYMYMVALFEAIDELLSAEA